MKQRRMLAPLLAVRHSRIVRRVIRRLAGSPESQLRSRA